MTNKQKSLINALLALATLLVSAYLWQTPLVLVGLLVAAAAAMFYLRPAKTSIAVYLAAFFFGPLAEVLAIHTGAWHYTYVSFWGIPYWLPFVWGNAGLFLENFGQFMASTLGEKRR